MRRPRRRKTTLPAASLAAVALVLASLAVAGFVAASAQATLPGRNGLIAFHAYRGSDEQMWVVRPDGTGLTRFPVYGNGAFSPDGRRIALATGRRLTVTDLNGHRLATIPTRRNSKRLSVNEPAWSPAGDLIYFDTVGGRHFAAPVSGGDPREVGRGGMALDVSVTGRVAYEIDPDFDGDSVIFTSDANGGDVRRVGRGSSPSWSPDGRRIAFERRNSIYVANADGSGAAPLANVDDGRVLYVAWSPDGAEIAVAHERSLEDEMSRLAVVNLASGAIRELVTAGKLGAEFLYTLDWQPLQGDDQIVLPQAPALGACDKLGAHTLLQTRRARIFTENDQLYGCLYSTGRVVRMAQGGGIDPTLGEVALAGSYVGYEIESDGTDDGPYADLFVQSLRTGRIKHATNSVDPSDGFFYGDVRKLVVTRQGALAWIVRLFSNKGNFKPLPRLQVQKLDRTGAHQLDAGPRIRPNSLRLRRHRLTWRQGTTRHSATLR